MHTCTRGGGGGGGWWVVVGDGYRMGKFCQKKRGKICFFFGSSNSQSQHLAQNLLLLCFDNKNTPKQFKNKKHTSCSGRFVFYVVCVIFT